VTVSRGGFVVRQSRGLRPFTDFVLPDNLIAGTAGSGGQVRAAFKSGFRYKGRCRRCRMKGRYAVASRPRSKILIENRPGGTFVAVFEGQVSVRDCVRRERVTIRTGERYLARRGRRRC
jgi:hypothetical protein